MEVKERLQSLGKELVEIHGREEQITNIVHLMENGLETILQVKKEKDATSEELELLRDLENELLTYGIKEEKINKNSVQQGKIYELTRAIKKEVEYLPKAKGKVYENLDEWISSLNLYGLSKMSIMTEFPYTDSYSLYYDLRKIVLNRNTDIKMRIYTGKIVDKMDFKENRQSLSPSCKIEIVAPELFGVMKLVRNNPLLNYRWMKDNHKAEIANSIVERFIRKNDAKMLVKRINALKDE